MLLASVINLKAYLSVTTVGNSRTTVNHLVAIEHNSVTTIYISVTF